MREVLQQLGRIPGVVGSMVCGPEGQLRAAEFPPVFDELALTQAAALFADATGGVRRFVGRGGELDLRFARGRAVVRHLSSGTLLVLGTYGLDVRLLGLSLEQAVRRLEGEGQDQPVRSQATALPDELQATRDGLREALALEIGPVADLVLEESWSRWLEAGTRDRSGWEAMVSVLASEVDDPASRARFLGAARALLG